MPENVSIPASVGDPPFSRRRFLTVPAGVALAGLVGASAESLAGQGVSYASTPGAMSSTGEGLRWPRGQVLPTYARPTRLDVTDASGLSGDDQALLTTLQGIVNRTRPRIYLLLRKDDTSDAKWLETLHLPTTSYADPMALVSKYRAEFAGAIVHDPDVPDSINVATTLAGLRNAIVASPAQVEAYGLKVVEDLRGRFDPKDRVGTYRWQLEQLFPHCTRRMLTGISPTMSEAVPGVTWTQIAKETRRIRDSSNRQTYDLDLSAALGGEAVYVRFTDSFTDDGWGPSVKHVELVADGTTFLTFDAGTPGEDAVMFDADGSSIGGDDNRFADGGNSFTYRFEPPAGTTSLIAKVDMWNQFVVSITDTAPSRIVAFPCFRDYIVGSRAMVFWLPPNGDEGALMSEIFASVAPTTPYLGWFSNDVAGEWDGVGLASRAGVEVLAADFYNNATVLSGATAPIRSTPPVRRTPRPGKKIYLTLTFGEGDNIQYDQHRMRDIWDNPDRGSVPMNWTIDPLLVDIGPAIYAYFQRTATDNDLLIAGPSGAGYTYPGLWPDSAIDSYTTMTGRYMRATGENAIYVFNNIQSTWTPLTERIGKSYRDNTPALGIILSWEKGHEFARPGGLPVIGNFSPGGGPSDYRAALDGHVADWDGSAALFVAGAINAWGWSPTQVRQLVESLDDRFEVLRGDVFLDLLGRSTSPTNPLVRLADRPRARPRRGRVSSASEPDPE